MKTKLFLLVPTLLISVFIFSFCSGSKENNSKQTSPDSTATSLDTSLDKYCGLYAYMNHYYYSVGRFPENSKGHTESGDKYLPLAKKFIGKYFIVSEQFSWETSKITGFAKGYIAPSVGSIILGVDKDGTMTIQNYDNYGTTGGDTLAFNLGGKGPGAKFILRSDGKYEMDLNNGQYVCIKKL